MRRGAAASSHNASSSNSPRAASTSAAAAPAIIHSSGQTILENNNNLNNNNNAFENNIRPATPVASSSSSSSSQYQTKMMNTSGGGNVGSNRAFRQSTASSTSHSSSSNSSTLHLSEQQISIKFGSVACLLSFCLILFGSGLVRESKLKRHEIPGDLHTRVFVEKLNKWNNIYRDEFERVEWMLIDNNFNDAQASPNIETLRSTTDATNYQAPKLAAPQTYEALKFQSSNLMETYVLPKIYPKYAEFMPSIDTLREAVQKGNSIPATTTKLLNKTSGKTNLNDAMNNTALVSRMLETPLSLSLVGKDTASNQIVASIDLGEQILFQKTILSHVNNKICKYQMGGYHTNTQNCETYSALLRVCFKVRKSGVEENARWVLDDTFGNFGCEPGSLTRVRGISSGSSSDSSSSSSSSSSSNSKSGDSNTGITNTAVNGNSDNGSLLWKPSIRKRIDAPQIKATLPDANKIRVAFAEQTVTIQHAFDPEIWLKNQTIFKRNYERHRAKVSIEGIVLIVVGSALGIPGVGLLLLGFIKRKRTVRSRRGYVQLQFPGPDYV